MDENKRKLVGYVGDEEIKLLEINGVLSSGRGSLFSQWLREAIQSKFGSDGRIKSNILQLESDHKALEAQRLAIEQRLVNTEKNLSELKHIADEKAKKDKLLEPFNLSVREKNHLAFIKGRINANGSYIAYKDELNNFNDSFKRELKLKEFEQILDLIEQPKSI